MHFKTDQEILSQLSSQLLRTCKRIYWEAASTLYRENTFEFQLPTTRSHLGVLQDPCLPDFSQACIDTECSRLFEYTVEDWRGKTSPILRDCILACFLRKIGCTNVAHVTKVKFSFHWNDSFSACRMITAQISMAMITWLLTKYCLSTRHFAMHFGASFCSPLDLTEESVVLPVIEDMVHTIPLLTRLDIEDSDTRQPEAMRLLQLKEIVEAQATVRRCNWIDPDTWFVHPEAGFQSSRRMYTVSSSIECRCRPDAPTHTSTILTGRRAQAPH